jgi:hypothetical protein
LSRNILLSALFSGTAIRSMICRMWGSHSGGYEESIFCDITQCIPLKVKWRFGGIFRLHLKGIRISQARNVGWLSKDYTALYPRSRKSPSEIVYCRILLSINSHDSLQISVATHALLNLLNYTLVCEDENTEVTNLIKTVGPVTQRLSSGCITSVLPDWSACHETI